MSSAGNFPHATDSSLHDATKGDRVAARVGSSHHSTDRGRLYIAERARLIDRVLNFICITILNHREHSCDERTQNGVKHGLGLTVRTFTRETTGLQTA